VHNSSPLLQLVGGSLQLGEQEVVQAGVAVEELSACDGPPLQTLPVMHTHCFTV